MTFELSDEQFKEAVALLGDNTPSTNGKPVAKPSGEAQGDLDASRKDALKALSKAAERIYLDREIAPMERLVHLRAVASDLDVRLRDAELQRFIWDVRRRLNGISDGYGPDDHIETPDDQWLHHGLLLA